MGIIRNFSTASNWNEVYTTTLQAQQASNGGYSPIANFKVPILLENFTFAVFVSSTSARASWYFGGYANIYIHTGLLSGGVTDAQYGNGTKLVMNEWTIIEVPSVASTYAIELAPPRYFKDISYQVYEYVGVRSDSVDDTLSNQILPSLNAIKAKLEA